MARKNGDRFVAKKGDMQMVLNRDIVCADCAYRDGSLDDPKDVAVCGIFTASKPTAVFLGADCRAYEKEGDDGKRTAF